MITVNHIKVLLQQMEARTAELEQKAQEELSYYTGAKECLLIVQQEIAKIEEALQKEKANGQGKENAGGVSKGGKEQKKIRKIDSARKVRQSSRK